MNISILIINKLRSSEVDYLEYRVSRDSEVTIVSQHMLYSNRYLCIFYTM